MTSSTCTPIGLPGPSEYLSLSDSLRQLRGIDFETHGHPAVVLDRATGPSTRVWGWWAEAEPPLPCLLWASERGWSTTVVEPGALDSEGYERAFWSHRVNLLDLALANAIGPFPTLEQLELAVASAGSFGVGPWATQLRSAVLWGILQLRAARAGMRRSGARAAGPAETVAGAFSRVDDELARHALVPTLAKSRPAADPARDAGVEALLRAVRKAALRRTEGYPA